MSSFNLKQALRLFALGLFASLGAPGIGSAQSIFVALHAYPKPQSSQTIPAPGYGWQHSAAAPVAGEIWNVLRRPEAIDITAPSLLTAGQAGTGRAGIFTLGPAEGTALVDAQDQPTSIRLLITLKVESLSTDKSRAEPSFYTKSKGAIPVGLMDSAWRVYHGDNSLTFNLSGLQPGKGYTLYIYAATFDNTSQTNPTGAGSGARFTLAPANMAPGKPNMMETVGGFLASLYTFDPETNKILLAPEGTTWGKLEALAAADGTLAFSTRANTQKNQMINGFQLIQSP